MHTKVCAGDVKAILFDCDGTLVDSEYTHYLSWKHAISTFGGDLLLEDYHQYVGKSTDNVANCLSKKIGNEKKDDIIKIKRDHYSKLCKKGLPSITSTVNFLKNIATYKKSSGIKIGICSSSRKNNILSNLKHLEVEHLMDIILSGQDDLKDYKDPEGVNKPKPYIYLHAMKMLNVSPNETIVIEDSEPGITAAVSAGCFTIAIPNSYTKHHNFSHADLLVESFENIDTDSFLKSLSNHILIHKIK